MATPARKPAKSATPPAKVSKAATPAPVPPQASKPAKSATPAPTPVPAVPPAHSILAPAGPATKSTISDPPFRCLRAFSIDPSLATDFETAPISEVIIKAPWEKLEPGPSGEYLDVIDVDPGSGCFYAPVDLNDPSLLAQNGLAPSEGTPQFHQQMAYAVSRLTINNFELALGRKTLWRPVRDLKKGPKDDSVYVPQLRIYPHALREANAYYSPDKVALLFGYFNADDSNTGEQLPGGTVFSCLSQDIVAHETTHALLDGMHRKFVNATNPDVLAFHEGFADVVALLQHFTFPEILRNQIANTRGELQDHQSLLGQLAGQFGHATGMRGALREAIGTWENGKWKRQKPDPAALAATTEPHARGAILVAAIFDAFLAIYERRTADLLRLATAGTGILEPGAIHPDLVERLSGEATKAARHVLTMCIRALDYCPPVDITFGEYLRAIITADCDLVEDDRLKYRIAFVEAFRRRGLYPPDVRTMSVDSLIWRTPENDEKTYSGQLEPLFKLLSGEVLQYVFAQSHGDVTERRTLFDLQRMVRKKIHNWLDNYFKKGGGRADAEYMGLDPNKKFEVHAARFALRTKPDGGVVPQLLVTVLQADNMPADGDDPNGPSMIFEGGSSIVADLRRRVVKYCIRKNLKSKNRLTQQQGFCMAQITNARSTYVNTNPDNPEREPFALLHRGL
jgi:hypothetical protein